MRCLLPVFLLLLVCPAAASAEDCAFFRAGAQVVREDVRGTIKTRVVICGDDGRILRTVVRARARGSESDFPYHQPARGTVIWAASLAGGRVAWAEGTGVSAACPVYRDRSCDASSRGSCFAAPSR